MILDYIDNLSVSDDDADLGVYAKSALARLAEGLFWLNHEMNRIEKVARARARKKDIRIALGGEVFGNIPAGQISSAFQWYAVSSFNYAQLVGWLVYRNSKQAKDYVTRVIPNLSRYRNKVAAHFGVTDPRNDDSLASLTAGLITNVAYAEGRFYIGGFSPKTMNGQEVAASNLPAWSLTYVHQELVKRFWRDGRPPSYNSVMVPAGQSVTMKINYLTGP